MAEEKTEQPTAKRLRDARQKGEVPRSRDLSGAMAVLGGAVALVWLGASLEAGARALVLRSFAAAAEPSVARVLTELGEGATLGASRLLPFLAVVLVAAAGTAFLQVGPLVAPAAVAPDLQRLSPAGFFGRVFGQEAWVEFAKAAAKIGLLVALAVPLAEEALRLMPAVFAHGPLAEASPAAGGLVITTLASSLLVRGAVLLVALGALDVFYQRHRFLVQRRMGRDEVRREHRESEGNPESKAARERVYREWNAQAALVEVRRADVLIVNPTHYAVALRYDAERDDAAPEVLSKGQDLLALRMIDAAREAGVPVMRDIPLAHALYALEEGTEIPAELYEAVAVVLRAAWAESRGEGDGAPEEGGAEGVASAGPGLPTDEGQR